MATANQTYRSAADSNTGRQAGEAARDIRDTARHIGDEVSDFASDLSRQAGRQFRRARSAASDVYDEAHDSACKIRMSGSAIAAAFGFVLGAYPDEPAVVRSIFEAVARGKIMTRLLVWFSEKGKRQLQAGGAIDEELECENTASGELRAAEHGRRNRSRDGEMGRAGRSRRPGLLSCARRRQSGRRIAGCEQGGGEGQGAQAEGGTSRSRVALK